MTDSLNTSVDTSRDPHIDPPLLTPGSDDFADSTEIFFSGPDRTPAAVARPDNLDDVVRAVRYARDRDLSVALRSGGHGYARHALGDAGALMIDLRRLDSVHIDPERRVGTAGGGALAGAYTTAAGQTGLATGFGDTGTVGIAGLTLGGGIGFLSRRDGLTVDNLLSAEVVLADGDVVVADAEHEPDLFWALRGGGGNFGIVTRLDFRLTPTPAVAGGFVMFEPDPAALVAATEAVLNGADALGGMVNAMLAPPLPMIPERLHRRPIVAALVCWSGPPDRADEALAPLRAAGTVIADTVATKPYPAMFEGGPPRPGGSAYPATRTGFTAKVDEAWSSRALAAIDDVVTPFSVINLRPTGGAIARVDPSATAFAHRDPAVLTTVAAQVADPTQLAPADDWTRRSERDLGLDGTGYVNFMTDASEDAVRAGYPAPTLDRLRQMKSAYDPANLFRHNHNVPPAA